MSAVAGPWDVRGEVAATRGDRVPDDIVDRHLQTRRGLLVRLYNGDPVWLDVYDSGGADEGGRVRPRKRTVSLTRPAGDTDPNLEGYDQREICLELDWTSEPGPGTNAVLQHLRSAGCVRGGGKALLRLATDLIRQLGFDEVTLEDAARVPCPGAEDVDEQGSRSTYPLWLHRLLLEPEKTVSWYGSVGFCTDPDKLEALREAQDAIRSLTVRDLLRDLESEPVASFRRTGAGSALQRLASELKKLSRHDDDETLPEALARLLEKSCRRYAQVLKDLDLVGGGLAGPVGHALSLWQDELQALTYHKSRGLERCDV